MKKFLISSIIFSIFIITACSAQPSPEATVALEINIVPTQTPTSIPTEAPTQTPNPTYSETQLSTMTNEEKLALAPNEIGDLTKSNVSENKNNIIVYRDADGTAQMAFDLTTAKELTLPEAGIIELDLTDGTKWETPAFYPEETPEIDLETGNVLPDKVIDEVIDFMIMDGVDWGNRGNQTLATVSEENYNFSMRVNKILNVKSLGGFMLPLDTTTELKDKFVIGYKSLLYRGENATLLVYIHGEDHVMRLVYVGMPVEEVVALLEKVTFP